MTREAMVGKGPGDQGRLSSWWSSATNMTRALTIMGALALAGVIIGGGLYLAFPVPISLLGAERRATISSV